MLEEHDRSNVFTTTLRLDRVFERQNENIILWQDVNASGAPCDLALSFQDVLGCKTIWDWIRQYQDSYGNKPEIKEARIMPLACVGNIGDIVRFLRNTPKNESTSQLLSHECSFLVELARLVEDLIDLDDNESLESMCEIWRSIALLNDQDIIHRMLEVDMFPQVAAAMDYDKILQTQLGYLPYSQRNISLKQVGLPMSSQLKGNCLRLIQLRLLKDYYVRPTIDEPGIGALLAVSAQISRNICHEVFSESRYIGIFADILCCDLSPCLELGSNKPESGEISMNKKDVLQFLRELFFMSRNLPAEYRMTLYAMWLCKSTERGAHNLSGTGIQFITGLCSIVGFKEDGLILEETDRVLAAEIMFSICLVFPNALRQAVLSGPTPALPRTSPTATPSTQQCLEDTGNQNSECLLWIIARELVEGSNCAVLDLLGDIVKMSVDVDPDAGSAKHTRDKYLGTFYDWYMPWFLLPFSGIVPPHEFVSFNQDPTLISCNSGSCKQPLAALSTSRRVLFELFSLCVSLHGHRIKYCLLRLNVLASCSKVLDSPHRHMHLGPIRLLRDAVTAAAKDEAIARHIIKQNLLSPLIKILGPSFPRELHDVSKSKDMLSDKALCSSPASGGSRDTLITSAVLGILELIRRENIKLLVSYAVELLVQGQERGKFSKDDDNDVGEETFAWSGVLAGLRLRHEQNISGIADLVEDPTSRIGTESLQRKRAYDDGEAEAAYFNHDDEDPLPRGRGETMLKSVRDLRDTWRTADSQESRLRSVQTRKYDSLALVSVYGDEDDESVDSALSVEETENDKDQKTNAENVDVDILLPIRPKYESDDSEWLPSVRKFGNGTKTSVHDQTVGSSGSGVRFDLRKKSRVSVL